MVFNSALVAWQAELFEVIKKRNLENNVSDDEDLGLPRSPVSNSPTTADPDDMFTKVRFTRVYPVRVL